MYMVIKLYSSSATSPLHVVVVVVPPSSSFFVSAAASARQSSSLLTVSNSREVITLAPSISTLPMGNARSRLDESNLVGDLPVADKALWIVEAAYSSSSL